MSASGAGRRGKPSAYIGSLQPKSRVAVTPRWVSLECGIAAGHLVMGPCDSTCQLRSAGLECHPIWCLVGNCFPAALLLVPTLRQLPRRNRWR